MATPSGTISLSNVNTELGFSPTALITMNDAAVRTLAGVPSGLISMQNLQNKSNRVAYTITISASANNYNTYPNRGPQYDPGKSDITYSINPGVDISSTSTGSAAFLVPSEFNPADTITIVNNGVIVGRGGNGGNGGPTNTGPGSGGGVGGGALLVSRPTIVTNNNRIAGGGGGGGGGAGRAFSPPDPEGGPEAYGGSGGGGGVANGSGGSGGVGQNQNGFPGSPAPISSPGAGGPSRNGSGAGGPGGAYGSSGTNGNPAPQGGGGSGGASGFAVSGNPLITWPAFGTRNGPIS